MKHQMRDSDKLLDIFAKTPFINGGLFDCLDSWEATGEESYRIDCFSDNQYKKLSIPNRLFFDAHQGLIPLLEHYKFTVEENTPIEQEVALDPELLGRVFENLLAAYQPGNRGNSVRKHDRLLLHPTRDCGLYGRGSIGRDALPKVSTEPIATQKYLGMNGYVICWIMHEAFDDASEWFDDRRN